jgi:hypothetical protein
LKDENINPGLDELVSNATKLELEFRIKDASEVLKELALLKHVAETFDGVAD